MQETASRCLDFLILRARASFESWALCFVVPVVPLVHFSFAPFLNIGFLCSERHFLSADRIVSATM
jgi:hypothetical protein